MRKATGSPGQPSPGLPKSSSPLVGGLPSPAHNGQAAMLERTSPVEKTDSNSVHALERLNNASPHFTPPEISRDVPEFKVNIKTEVVSPEVNNVEVERNTSSPDTSQTERTAES